VELALLPHEDAEDDLADLGLDALPEVLRRERAHLHEHLPLTLALGDGLDRGLVLLDRDLALADQDLPQPVVGEVAGGEDDPSPLEIEGLPGPSRDEREDAGRVR
jgi:hypothetical protein